MKAKTKKRKYLGGGFTANTSNLKVPTLAKKLPNELSPGPTQPGSTDSIDPTAAGSAIADMGSSVLSGLAKSAIDNADPRSNPAIAMKKANTMNTAGDLLSATAKGAAVGGPWGAAAGLLTAGIGKIIGAKKQRKDLDKAQSGWASENLDSYSTAMDKSSYAKGGTIKGKGTGKSDSINMKAKNGSFIVPSENAEYGRQLGEEYLGWKPGEKAEKKNGGVAIKASNSEVMYTPEEVRILNYHGVDLNALAPKANGGKGNASGGIVGTSMTTSKAIDYGKQTVYRPGTDQQYDKDLVINPGWDKAMSKGSSIDDVNNSVIGTWNDKPLTAGMFKEQFPARVRNTWNFDFEHERQKNRLKLPNEFEKLNMKASPKDVYLPSKNLKSSGNKVAYVGPTKYATGGPVVTAKKKPSMTGALVSYMKKPKDTAGTLASSDPNNTTVTRKQRNAEKLDKWSSDPKNMKDVVAMGSMSGSLVRGSNILNKIDAIEAIANSPKNARLGKWAQDVWREMAPKMSPEEFQKHADLEGLSSLGKHWTYGDVIKTKYKKGGKVMKAKYATGGIVTDIIKREAEITPAEIPSELLKPKKLNTKLQRKPGSTLKSIKPRSPAKDLDIGFAEVASAIQAAGGAYGLATAKSAPDVGVSETLKNLSADVRKQASYGLEPDQLNVLNNSVERSRRDTNRFITESGGSGQEVMSKLSTSLGTTIAGKESIAFQDAAEKTRKMTNVINVDSQIGNQEFDVKRMRKEDWYKNQEVFASLLSTGIENVIGARQFKEQQKTFRDRDNRPVFNFKE